MKKYGGVNNEQTLDEIGEAIVLKEPTGFSKPTQELTQHTSKRHPILDDLVGGLVFLWIASPLLTALIVSTCAKDFSESHPLLVFIISIIPLALGIFLARRLARR